MKDLIRKAGAIAREVADNNNQEILVAGSLPPLDESYRPDLVPNEKESIPIYEELIDELNSFVDIFFMRNCFFNCRNFKYFKSSKK